MVSKCPYCEKSITYVDGEEIEIRYQPSTVWRGASYFCPFCKKIISIQMDSDSIKPDVVKEIKK